MVVVNGISETNSSEYSSPSTSPVMDTRSFDSLLASSNVVPSKPSTNSGHNITTSTTKPLFTHEDIQRFILNPKPDPEINAKFQQAIASIWVPDEIDFSEDKEDWEKLPETTKHFLKHVLAFFATSDSIVNENIVLRFYNDAKDLLARLFYGQQIATEGIHTVTYNTIFNILITDPEERTRLLEAMITMPCIAKKAKWALDWIDNQESFATRLVAMACVEGIFFSGSFCAIYWIREQNVMKGLTQSNEFISKDENLHCEFSHLMYSKENERLSEDRIKKIVLDAVQIEKEFILDAIPVSLIGMNSKEMGTYIEYIADRILMNLGCSAHFGSSNPFSFMEQMSINTKTAFFERRNTNYRKSMYSAPKAHHAHQDTVSLLDRVEEMDF